MRIKAGFEITYDCPAPTPMLLMLNVHPDRQGDLETPDTIHIDPDVRLASYVDGFGNRCSRVVLPAGRSMIAADFVVGDSGLPDPQLPDAKALKVEHLPDDVVVYLLGSRYCETDTLSDLAWSLFGNIPAGWGLVQAIVDYTQERIAFGYAHARATKSAWQANEERLGVCRDFAHLAITLCRCMNIPARYCTGYLGDIGVAPIDAPMDFSAWFEAYLDGGWQTFDARHNSPRIGRILIARGRDATDAAITTSFGPALLQGFIVKTEELSSAG
jgi:transglutaminase-like putative cysteine protease